MMDYGVDQFGRPKGYGQTSPYRQRPRTIRQGEPDPNSPTPPQPQPQQGSYNYSALRDRWMAQQGNQSAQTAQAFLDANRDVATGVKLIGDKFDLDGDGRGDVDVVMGHKAGGNMAGPQWTNPYGASGAPSPMGGPMGGGPMPMGGGSRYTPGTLPSADLPVYRPGTLPQFQRPSDYGLTERTAGLIGRFLSSPTFDPATVAAMKERDKEAALTMGRDLVGESNRRFASLGRADSGAALAAERDINSRMLSDILARSRDIDIGTTTENRAALERAAGLSGDFLNAQTGRESELYRTGLAGALSQEDLNQRGVASEADRIRFALDRALAQEGLNQTAAGIGLQELGLGLDARRLDETSRQFNADLNYRYGRDAQAYNQWLISQILGM